LGKSVASAGDVNGDGYGDVIAGAIEYTNGEYEEGAAFVYIGSASGLSSTASTTLEGNQIEARLGYSVASADVNGDGFSDVVVGAPFYDNGESDEGVAFLYIGSASGLSNTPIETLEGNQADSYWGASVATAGDVNGDGFADVIVGARYYDNGESNEGAAFVYYGNSGDNTGLGLSLTPQTRQPQSSTPISPGLTSTSDTSFDVALATARHPAGRVPVALQIEVKPLGTLFDGTNLLTTSYTDSGLTGVAIQETIDNLDLGTGYHWRARVAVSPATGTPQGWGHWLYGGLSGHASGAHVFTAAPTLYADSDGDGFGDPAVFTTSRGSPAGYVPDNTDCDDTNAAISPAAVEICDALNLDENCNGLTNDADPTVTGQSTFYADTDGDGYGDPLNALLATAPYKLGAG
jgi:hypothetical protein